MGRLSGYYKVVPLTAVVVCSLAVFLFISQGRRSPTVLEQSRKLEPDPVIGEVDNSLPITSTNKMESITHSSLFPDSELVTDVYGKRINEWLGVRTSWRRIYSGVRDGLYPESFHNFVDDRGECLIVIQDENENLFGAYTSVGFMTAGGDGRFCHDNGHFLFTLKNPFGIPPTKFTNKYPFSAISYVRAYGPSFGDHGDLTIRGHDGHFSESHSVNFPWSYTDLTGKGNVIFTGKDHFSVKNIEVFVKEYACLF